MKVHIPREIYKKLCVLSFVLLCGEAAAEGTRDLAGIEGGGLVESVGDYISPTFFSGLLLSTLSTIFPLDNVLFTLFGTIYLSKVYPVYIVK